MPKWSLSDIPDQSGRIAVVTGANSGLGFVTARELARAGARVVLACRDATRGEQALERMRAEVPGGELELRRLDLADLASVRAFAQEVGDAHGCARPARQQRGRDGDPAPRDGGRVRDAVRHEPPRALRADRAPAAGAAARRRAPRRHASSGAHRSGGSASTTCQGERRYFRWAAYGQSKLANLLFAYELQRRADAAGLGPASLAAHPGYAATNLQFAGAKLDGSRLEALVMKAGNLVLSQSDEMGALPTLYAATVPALPGGSYYGPDGFLEQRGHPHRVSSTAASNDAGAARAAVAGLRGAHGRALRLRGRRAAA